MITYVDVPTVVTDAATLISPTAATLNATVTSDENANTTATFEYGLTMAYGSTGIAAQSPVAAGALNTPVSAAVTGLTANTLYHFRASGVNSTGTANGADRTFTTLPPQPPTLTKTASSASVVVGDVMTFTVVLDNPSAAALNSVTVSDILPAGMSYGTHVASLGTLNVVGQTLTWSIPSVPVGGSATLTLAVSLTQQGVLTNTVTSTGITSASASVLVLAGAVTHFRLDEPAGSWTGAAGEVIDSGTTGLHGKRLTTATPTTTNEVVPSSTIASQYSSVVGGFCNAAQFDGKAVVQVADSPLFDYTKTLSASAWIYPTAYPTSDLYSILSNDVNYEFHLNTSGKLYWWWNASTLTSAATIPLNQWTHIAITFDSTAGRQRIYINGVQDSNTNNWTGTLQANACNFYIGGDVATGSCNLLPARNFRGMIDEVKLYNTALSAAEVQADMTLGRSCSGTYDHIQIEHDGSGSVCTPETVTVKACLNASCSTLYPGAVTVQLSPAGWVGGNTFTFSGGIASRQLSNGSAGNVTLGTVSASPLPANSARCFIGSTESCTLSFANASCSFDAVEPAAAPQTRIFTKLAGTPFNVDLLALSSGTTINAGYTGTVAVDLVDTTTSACPTGSGLSAAANIAFVSSDSGRKQVAFTYTQAAANVRVRMKAGAAAAACSTDNFAIRPAQLTVAAPVMNNTGLTGTPQAVAGSTFTLEANAGVAAGYAGTIPTLDASKVKDHNNTVIATGTLSGVFSAGDGIKASGTTFKYLDVGSIQLAADAVIDGSFTSVDQTNDCIANSTSNTLSAAGKYGCNIGSAVSGKFGRWHPSHFSFSGALTASCVAGGYTYMDQDALGVVLALKAHASSGATASASDPVASRYTSGYTNLAGVTISGDNSGTAVAVTRLTNPAFPVMPDTSSWSAGLFQISDSYMFTKLAAPDGPYDFFKLRAAVSDPDGGSLIGSLAQQETNTTKIRYGRLRLQNAYGSELLALPVPLEAQYWTGNYYAANGADNCTVIPISSITMGNYLKQLNACETQLSPAGNVTMVAGKLPGTGLVLTKPGANNAGSVDLAINVSGIAAGNTCVGAAQSAATAANMPWFGPNQGARATFGIYRSPLIYRRENY
ncbi:MAG: LamG-like jellyroll fold domain-containing protein [Rhodoferax sp.]|uniref:DUF6701 domain-containing protein n=1 Tax=Rhodoferax sp. TaxID=50421 RepID=UPI002725B7F6|nr:DUF6701 domain-containing protein [Rhodoferax sp.]MDO8447624.1 LamG-like jellyroll fold domain-containing protein [Rhodoferax sp.]